MTLTIKQAHFTAIQKLLLLSVWCFFSVSAWSPELKVSRISFRSEHRGTRIHSFPDSSSIDENPSDSSNSQAYDTRRRFLTAAAANLCFMGAAAPMVAAADAPLPPGTKYISGKTPLPPGETRKKSDNPKGTRKDPEFLRSVSDCKNQCQSGLGPDGLAKSKEDCLSDCQDICCKTYEQCTFNIVPRI